MQVLEFIPGKGGPIWRIAIFGLKLRHNGAIVIFSFDSDLLNICLLGFYCIPFLVLISICILLLTIQMLLSS